MFSYYFVIFADAKLVHEIKILENMEEEKERDEKIKIIKGRKSMIFLYTPNVPCLS